MVIDLYAVLIRGRLLRGTKPIKLQNIKSIEYENLINIILIYSYQVEILHDPNVHFYLFQFTVVQHISPAPSRFFLHYWYTITSRKPFYSPEVLHRL